MDGTIGEVRIFGGTFAPQYWFSCTGSIVDINQFTALFSIIGTYYGGDGRTTFGLPDIRARAIMGAGQAPGLTDRRLSEFGGQIKMYLSHLSMPSHTHTAALPPSVSETANPPAYNGTEALTNIPGNNYPAKTADGTNIYSPDYDTVMGECYVDLSYSPNTGSTGEGAYFDIMQPSIVVNYIICALGDYPSRN